MSDKKNYTPNFKIPFLFQNQAHKDIVINESFSKIDIMLNLNIIDIFINTPPDSYISGDAYIISDSPTGIFENNANEITYFNSGWKFITPKEGLQIWVQTQKKLYIFTENKWEILSKFNGDTNYEQSNEFDSVGINTSASDYNKLSVCSNDSLFTTQDSSVRISLNKASSTDIASVVFKNNWKGMAEFGLFNNNDFVLKKSVDGSNFEEVFVINNLSGDVDFKNNIQMKGLNIVATRVGDYKTSHYYDDHDRWLLCDGRHLKKQDFLKLYNIIGVEFGLASDSANFIIPNISNDFGRVFINY